MGRVAYLGPEGTFTHQAARDLANHDECLLPMDTAPEVIRAVEARKVAGGVVAFENSRQGEVPANIDELLASAHSVIAGERIVRISFTLFRSCDDEAQLRGVISHPFALAQCSTYLAGHSLASREATSTVEACRQLQETPMSGWGALAPAIAGERYGLRSEAESVQDDDRAATRFLLLRTKCPRPSGRDRSAFALLPRQDDPGSLVRMLQEFSLRSINLTAIRSRPTKGFLGEYVFFIECEGHILDDPLRETVVALGRLTTEVRFVGSFPEDPARSMRSEPSTASSERYEQMLTWVE